MNDVIQRTIIVIVTICLGNCFVDKSMSLFSSREEKKPSVFFIPEKFSFSYTLYDQVEYLLVFISRLSFFSGDLPNVNFVFY